ncbi:MAG: nitroreductase family deazaflavin-dependent oxidoreductase [Deltaproteobacteria bacterium]|nr:nitroreductase family deazaflavin-dependent oxidoreductase [Deltaproteobacteria bacterium]MBW2359409.1 nitroreductase family deazaflavin-dependent oxidoreductase [Deltaproteobacteria bacterium]
MALVNWKNLARRFAVEPRWLAWDRLCVRITGWSFVNRAFEEAAGMSSRPALLLTTRHHVNGRERTVVLPYYVDADRFVVVGSHGGRPTDAIWALNLRAHPDVRIRANHRWRDVRCHEAKGEERDGLWRRITADGAYLHYEKTAAPRIIPLMVFTPR